VTAARASLIVVCVLLAVCAIGVGEAHAEPLPGLSDCPACATTDGGAEVVDVSEILSGILRSTVAAQDPSWSAHSAAVDQMLADYATDSAVAGSIAAPAGSAAGVAGTTTADIAAAESASGLLPELLALMPPAALAGADAALLIHDGSMIWKAIFPPTDSNWPAQPAGYSNWTSARLVVWDDTRGWVLNGGAPVQGAPPPGCSALGIGSGSSKCLLLVNTRDANTSDTTGGFSTTCYGVTGPCPSHIWPWPPLGYGNMPRHSAIGTPGLNTVDAGMALGEAVRGGKLDDGSATNLTVPPPTAPARGSAVTNVNNGLTPHHPAQKWYQCELTHSCPDPAVATFTMPNVLGQSAGSAQSTLTLAGSTSTANVTTADWLHADTAYPANTVIKETPAPDTLVPHDLVIELLRNPDSMFMPKQVPKFDDGSNPPLPPLDGNGNNDECERYFSWLDDAADQVKNMTAADIANGFSPTLPTWASSAADLQTLAQDCDPYKLKPGHMDYWRYLKILAALGIVGKVVFLSPDNIDPDVGPGGVVSVTPGSGTKRLPIASPTPSVLLPGSTVAGANPDAVAKVVANPVTGADPAPGSAANPTGPGSSGYPVPPTPGFDLGPLHVPSPCNVFPFGVPCWVKDAVSKWSAPSTPWTFDFAIPNPGIGDGNPWNIHVDLGVMNPALAVVRPIIVIGATIMIGWLFFGLAMSGTGPASSGSDE
jgi:hypothetical protein